MDEFGRFLAQLGLQRHEAAFRENDVDLDVLRVLSEADLRELGLSLGHRRKLLAAIAAGRGSGIRRRRAVGGAACRRRGGGAEAAHRHVLRPRRLDGARGGA